MPRCPHHLLPLASRPATLQKGVSQRRRQNPMPPLPTLPYFFVLTHRSSYLRDRCDKSHYPSLLLLLLRPTPINSFLNPLLLDPLSLCFCPLAAFAFLRTNVERTSVQGVGCAFNWGGLSFLCPPPRRVCQVFSLSFLGYLRVLGHWPPFPRKSFSSFRSLPAYS